MGGVPGVALAVFLRALVRHFWREVLTLFFRRVVRSCQSSIEHRLSVPTARRLDGLQHHMLSLTLSIFSV